MLATALDPHGCPTMMRAQTIVDVIYTHTEGEPLASFIPASLIRAAQHPREAPFGESI